MRKIIAIVVVFLCLFGMIGCTPFPSLWGDIYELTKENTEWDGNFLYYQHEGEYYIVGAHPEIGEKPENLQKLYLPIEHNGKPVNWYCIELNSGRRDWFGIDITEVKEIYYPYNQLPPKGFLGTRNYTKVVIPYAELDKERASPAETYKRQNNPNVDVYVPAIMLDTVYNLQIEEYEFFIDGLTNDKLRKFFKDFAVEKISDHCLLIRFTYLEDRIEQGGCSFTSTIYKANTAFMFNYEDAPNMGYFFINDFERGGLIENYVYEPTREGYTFKGWYKDSECTQKWDFEVDTLPAPTYDENGQLEYVETKLYAGWTKI